MSSEKILYIPGFMGKVDESSFLDGLEYEVICFDLVNADVDGIPESLKEMVEKEKPDYIYAYSMGGRILLSIYDQLTHRPKKVILESVGLEIPKDEKKKARYKLDQLRAQQIREDFAGFLQSWYFMPMWNFSKVEKERMIKKRQDDDTNPEKFAQSIIKYSPSQFPPKSAKRPIDVLKENNEIFYIVGEKDTNYHLVYTSLKSHDRFKQRVFEVNEAGHNVHFQKSEELLLLLKVILGQ
ncbi:MAG: hypothetical protein K9K67_03750 [Bacteriovoracaceae bacterium]|nr:hypothetical protein [Bacteriovoracaceae bacterium]